jgi:hypothetical protein
VHKSPFKNQEKKKKETKDDMCYFNAIKKEKHKTFFMENNQLSLLVLTESFC